MESVSQVSKSLHDLDLHFEGACLHLSQKRSHNERNVVLELVSAAALPYKGRLVSQLELN